MMTGGRDMPRITPNHSIRILAKGRLCARVAILVALGTFLLAGRAYAASAAEPAGEASSPASVVETAPEASSSSTLAAEPVVELAPEASSSAEPVASSPPEASSPSPTTEPAGEASDAESSGEAPSSTPSASAPETSTPAQSAGEASSSTPAEPVVESPPEASSPSPVAASAPETLPPAEQIKEVKEAPAAEQAKEVKEAPVAESIKEAMQVTATAGQDAAPANSPAAAVGPEASSAPDGAPTTTFPIISGESQTPSVESSTDAVALARRVIAAQRAEDFTRELGGLGASSTDTYTAGFDSPSLISAAFVRGLATGTAARAGAPAPGRSSGSPGGSSPIGPPPGSAPSGTCSGAAPGGSGTALSGFSTFAGHLLPGAPLAMRRLRLSFQPWLTAFFVLIPERPG
jgi:S-DNA-T family DNA segregation ATPase FtsK/SpoIIIE